MRGLPCVTTAFEGAGELFGDSESCLMVLVGDENAMADAMARLDDEPQFRDSFSNRGQLFAERFATEKIIPLWEKELR